MKTNCQNRFNSVEEEQNHYMEMCFGERERLRMQNETPFRDNCKGCNQVDWRREWEAIKTFDVANYQDEVAREKMQENKLEYYEKDYIITALKYVIDECNRKSERLEVPSYDEGRDDLDEYNRHEYTLWLKGIMIKIKPPRIGFNDLRTEYKNQICPLCGKTFDNNDRAFVMWQDKILCKECLDLPSHDMAELWNKIEAINNPGLPF